MPSVVGLVKTGKVFVGIDRGISAAASPAKRTKQKSYP